MTSLTEQIVVLHERLSQHQIPHAFGGALALAWCTQRARGTIDIDVNLFIDATELDAVLAALPPAVTLTDANIAEVSSDGQTRLWWDETPVDVFFNTTDFHRQAAQRTRTESFGGAQVPFLSCTDIAVFKSFFNRTKDWADLEEMADAGCLDVTSVIGVIATYLGGDDERIERLRRLH